MISLYYLKKCRSWQTRIFLVVAFKFIVDLNNKTIRLTVGRSPGILPVLLALVVFGFAFSLGDNLGYLFTPLFSPVEKIVWQTNQVAAKNFNPSSIKVSATSSPASLKNISGTGTLLDPLSQDWSDHLAGFRYAVSEFGDFLWQSSADYLSLKLDSSMNLLAGLWGSVAEAGPAWPEDLSVSGQESGVKILSVGEAKIRTWNEKINQGAANLNLALVSQTNIAFGRLNIWVASRWSNVADQSSASLIWLTNIFTEQITNTKTEISLSAVALADVTPSLAQAAVWPIKTLTAVVATWPQQLALDLANQSDQFFHFSRRQSSQLASWSAGSAQFSREELSRPIFWVKDLKSFGRTRTIRWWSRVADWTTRTQDNAKLGLTYSLNQVRSLAAVRLANLSFSWPEWQAFFADHQTAIIDGLRTWWRDTTALAINNWRYFLGWNKAASPGVKTAVATTTSMIIDTKALEEKIKAEVRAELKQDLAQLIRQSTANNISPTGQSGLVVMPSTRTAAGDENLKNQIQAMFSDRVSISFDANRKAGVVAPVFAPPGSDNYIFLLAPIKK